MDEKLLREMFDKFQREDAAKAAAHADAAPADESKKADEKPADVEKKEADKKDTAAPADESKKADEKPVDESKKADLGKADESTVQQKREDDEVAKLRAEIATLKASHEAMANPKLITDEDEVKISELLEDDQKLHNAFADQSMRPLTRGQFDTLQTLQSRAIVKWGAKADAFKDERIDVTSMSPMAVRAYWNTLKAAAHADAAVMEKPTNYLMWDASGKQTLNYVDWRTKIDQEKSRRINGIQSETNKV